MFTHCMSSVFIVHSFLLWVKDLTKLLGIYYVFRFFISFCFSESFHFSCLDIQVSQEEALHIIKSLRGIDASPQNQSLLRGELTTYSLEC